MLDPCGIHVAQYYIIGQALTNTDSHIKAEANIYYANNLKRISGANVMDTRVYTLEHNSKGQIPLRYLVADRFEAKFLYAIWSQTGPKLVADLSQTC